MDSSVFEIDEDFDVLVDFYEDLVAKIEEIDNLLIDCIDRPADNNFHKLMAILNTLAGSASNCNLAPVVEPIKSLEMLVDRMRARKILFSEKFRYLINQVLGLVQFIAQEASENGEVSFSLFIEVQAVLHPVVTFENDFEESVNRSIAILEGNANKDSDGIDLFGEDDGIDLFGDDELFDSPAPEVVAEVVPTPAAPVLVKEKKPKIASLTQAEIIHRDLSFFRTLGGFANKRRKGSLPRAEVILPIALGMNAIAKMPVNFFQLEAAVYLHDIALLRLHDTAFTNAIALDSQTDLEHPLLAFEMLSQMRFWEDAAKIVYQHQERYDGHGYPEQLKENQICEGAKILAICDRFYAVAHEKEGQRSKQSIIMAISEINNCKGSLFDPKWVEYFNQTVRIQHKIGAV